MPSSTSNSNHSTKMQHLLPFEILFSHIKIHVWRMFVFVLTALIFSFSVVTVVSAARLAAPPGFTVTKTDAIINDDGDGKADPGETIEYTIVLNSTVPTTSTGIVVDETTYLDPYVTYDPASANISPLAMNDSYQTIGNTLLDGGTGAADPAVHVAGLFANDAEFIGVTFGAGVTQTKITSHTSPTNGALLTFDNNTGAFTYLPNVGFTGSDSFTYTLTDVGGLTDTGTVTITVNAQRVWYVKNDAGAGDGRSSSPFNTLAAADAAALTNPDTIYVFRGNGTTSGQNSGIALESGQRLIGEGVALTVPVSLTQNGVAGPNPTTLKAVGTRPLIGNSAGNGVSVSTASASFSGVEIRGLDISGAGAGNNAIDVATSGAFNGSVEIANNVISAAIVEGIDVTGSSTGTLTISIHDNNVTATGNGIDIVRMTGSGNLIVTTFDDNVITGNNGSTGISIFGAGTTTVLFDSNPGTAAFDTVLGGATAIGQSGNGVNGHGLFLDNVRGDLSFSDLDIFADNGAGLFIDGSSSNYTGSSGMRVMANTGTPTITSTNNAALDVTEVNINLALSSLTNSNSLGSGISMVETSGTFSATSGTISNAAAADIFIDGNSVSSASVSASYAGTITDDIGELVWIRNVTGGSPTYAFTGAITDNNDGDGTEAGVLLDNNDSATITFSGGLVIRTTINPAFTATNGGTVNVCNTNPCSGGSAVVNTLTSTTGMALNVANTNIGSSNLEFQSISSNGAVSGIVLNNTGGSGGLAVTGIGIAASGGTIQNSTGNGISLTNTANVSLAFMNIQSSGDDGINGATITNFSINGANVTNNGNSTADEGIEFDNLFGTSSITNTTVTGNAHNNFDLNNSSGVLTSLNVTGSNFSSNSNANGNHGFLFDARLTALVTAVTVSNSTFSNNKVIGMQVITGDTATISSFIVSNSIFSDTGTGNSQEISADFSTAQTSNLNYQFLNNTLTGHNSQAFNTFTGAGAGTGGTLNAIIQGNIIGNAGVPGSGSLIGNGMRININGDANANVLVDNNTIRQTPNGRGIEAIVRNGTGGLDLTVTNNDVNPNDVSGFPLAAIFIQSNCVTICNTLRTDVRGNTVPVGTASGEILPTFIAVVETDASTCQLVDNSPASASATAELTESHTNPAHNNTGSASASAGCALIAGPIGYIPSSNRILAQNQAETVPMVRAEAPSANITAVNAFTTSTSSSAKLSKQAVWVKAAAITGGGKPHLRSVRPAPLNATLIPSAGAAFLPPNKSLTITFRVTVNDGVTNNPPLPLGKTHISNWAEVLADGASIAAFSDDPDTVTPNDPTLTEIDLPDATITSITRTTPSASLTNASSVTWTVTFNTLAPASPDGLTGLDATNFTLVQGGSGPVSGASISSVTAVGGEPSNVWTVTADTGSGDGTLGLNLVNDTGLSHDILTSLPFTGQTYTIDKTAPTVISFTRETPSGQFTNADTLVFRAAFSEQIMSWDTDDFAVNGSTTATVTNVSQFTVLHYDVTISGGDLATFNGVVGLNFNSPTITDLAGNPLAATEPSTDQTYTVDNTAPETAIDAGPPDPSNDSTPTFTFSGDDGAGSGVASFQCKVDSGSYAACTSPFTVSPALLSGSHTFYVYAIDNATNADATPATYTWELDTLPPPAPVTVSPANASSTNDTTPTATGTAEANSTVTVYFDSSLAGTTTANGSGNWSFTPSPLSDGSHTVKATATDDAGNTSVDSNTNTFTVDATGPDTFIDSGPSNPTGSSATFTFHGTDTGGTGVASFECQLDAGSFSACTSPHTYNSLSDGSHTFTVQAIDNVGNVDLTSASYIWTVDTIAPTTTLTLTPPDPSASANASFSFTGNDGGGSGVDYFECLIDSGAFITCTSPKTYLGLSDGSHTFQVRAVDQAGNADGTPASFTWVIDTTPPPAPVVSTPANGGNTTNPQPLVSGTAEINSTVTVFLDSVAAGTTTANGSGNWSFTPPSPLSDGLHTAKARATDTAGNTSVDSNTNTFTVDTTAPDTTINTYPTHPTTSTSAAFTFSGTDGSGVGGLTFECRLDAASFTACDTASTQNYTGLADGNHTFRVRATDSLGNIDSSPASYTWMIDTTAPDTTLTATPPDPSASANASFSFTGNDGGGSGVMGFECKIDTGSFIACSSPQAYTGLSDGSHTFQVRAVDQAGNADGTPSSFTWAIDTTPPPAPVVATPADGSSTTNAQPSVSGTAEVDSTVTVFLDSVSAGTTTANGSGNWSFTPSTPLSDGSHTVKVRATDAAGNTSVDSNTNTFMVDTTAPNTIIDAPTPPSSTNATSAIFNFHGDDGAGVGTSGLQCKLDTGSYVACDAGSISYVGLLDGPHIFRVYATDSLGNTDATPATYTWTVDTIIPTVVLSSTATSPSNLNPIPVTITFSEPVDVGAGPGAGDLTVTNGAASVLSGGPTVYTFDLTPAGSGLVTATYNAGGATDAANNGNTVSNTLSITSDLVRPTVTVEQGGDQGDPTGVIPVHFTAIFSEAITGLTGADTDFTGSTVTGTLSAIVTEISINGRPMDGKSYDIAVSGMTSSGLVVASLPENKAIDAAKNGNTASTSLDNTVTFNSAPFTVTINQAAGQADPTSVSPIHFTAVFSEGVTVTGFTAGDINYTGSTVTGTLSATIIQIAPMNGTTYDVEIRGMTSPGNVVVNIPAGVVTSGSRPGVNNLASTSTDATVTYMNPVSVTINQAAGQADPTTVSPIHFTAVFSEAVSGFTGTDVSFTGTTLMGTLSATITQIAPMNGTTYDVAVKGMIPKGTVFVSIPAGKVASVAHPGVTNKVSTSTDSNVIFDYVLAEFLSIAAKDGWLLESTETSGVGGSMNNGATTLSVGDDASDRQYRSVVNFLTASLPDNAVIYSVNLRMIEAGVTGSNPFATHGALKSEIKSDFFGTSGLLETLDFQSAPNALACNFETIPEIMSIGSAYRCVVLSAAFPHINLTSSTQFRLRFTLDDNDDLSADIFDFYSGNHPTSTQTPRLFIKYYLPPTP